MTLCLTYRYVSTNDSPFEAGKKQDKIGEYWVSAHCMSSPPPDIHSVSSLDFAAAVYLDSWTLCQTPQSTTPFNVSGMQELLVLFPVQFLFDSHTRSMKGRNLVNTISKGMPIKFSKICLSKA